MNILVGIGLFTVGSWFGFGIAAILSAAKDD